MILVLESSSSVSNQWHTVHNILTLERMNQMIWVKLIHDQQHKCSKMKWQHSKPMGMRMQRIHNLLIYAKAMVVSDEIHLYQ